MDPLSPIRELVARVATLESQLAAAHAESATLRAENARLREENVALHHAVLALTREVEALKRRLGSGGRGGGRGTPPPTRPPSGKRRGGQPGHKGHARTRPEHIDQTLEHSPAACPRCGGDLAPSARSTERFEFEAVERALHILRHVLHQGWCSHCKRRVKAHAPFALPDSDYGPRAHATLAGLRATMGATVGNLENYTRSVWQWPVSGGQIVAMLDRTAAALVPTFWWIIEQITHEPVVYEDTTSWAFDGERAVLWVFTTPRLTVYWIDPSGSGRVPQAVLGDKIDGSVVTDEAERFQYVAHASDQRCLAHPLREARDLLVLHPGDAEIEAMMVPLRDHLSWMIGLYPRRDDLAASTWLQYRKRARRELIALADRPWTNEDCVRMAKRIHREVDLWVTFLWDLTGEMEPTDNRSERALRPAVIDRGRVQQNRSLGGVYRDMVLRSVAQTCQQLEVGFETVVAEALLSRTRDGPAATPSATLVAAFQAARARSRRETTPAAVAAGR
ncbi:MAG: transposase [Deltaproteobacteria bacterium]|nr:transposase [Deltaproteobacteria bacterium]